MTTIPYREPGERSFFAGQLAAWSRRLSDKRIGAYAKRETITAISIQSRKQYERYCNDLLVRGLAAEIIKQSLTMRCETDPEGLFEGHSVECVVLTLEEFKRLQSDLLHAARVIEEYTS